MQNKAQSYDLWEEMSHPPKLFFEDEVRDGFLVSTMMKRFWAAQLKVLAEIDKICKKHSLRWFADYGTLLGAVRHGGYIPWDDDMDICMLRDDYVQFIEYACEELPEGYEVMTLQKREDYEYSIGRINNTHFINYTDEHLESHFGCPYLVGIDIFPLDGLYDDEKKEEERVGKLRDIATALLYIKEDLCENEGFEVVLKKIEADNKIKLDRDEGLKRKLMLLADSMYYLVPTKDAKDIVMMTHWASRTGGKYKKEWFKDTIYLPYEYVHLPAPACFDAVLNNEFYNFIKVNKGGGAHAYPLYSGQEAILKKEFGGNPYRYTMPEEIREKREVISVKERCTDILQMLKQVSNKMHQLHDAGQFEAVTQLMTGCNTLVSSLETIIRERARYEAVVMPMIDGYREAVDGYHKSERVEYNSESIEMSDKMLDGIISAIDKISVRKEVLFLPVKAEWWPSMEHEWEEAIADENNDVYVMPLLYLEKDFVKDNGEEKNDGHLLPDYVKQTRIEDYDIAKRHPDVVYIQDPYDGHNTMIAVPSYFYSDNLLKFTDELIYVPCYEVDDPESEDDKITSALRIIVEQPAVYNADKVKVQSDLLRKVYIDILTTLTGKETEKYWTDKVVTATPISDEKKKSIRKSRADGHKTLFLTHYGRIDDENKKIIAMQINPSFIIQYGLAAVNKIRERLSSIKQRNGRFLIVYSPHSSLNQLEKILEVRNRDILDEYKRLKQEISEDFDVLTDTDSLLNEIDLDFADMYYGTSGILANKCMMNDIPVLIMTA